MNPYEPSSCPLCRARFAHLPRVCGRLHALLAAAFPQQYAQRARETRELETAKGIESEAVVVDDRLTQSAASLVLGSRQQQQPQQPQQQQQQAVGMEAGPHEDAAAEETAPAIFACDACSKLLLEPSVLPCAHVVCRGCIPARAAQQQWCCPVCNMGVTSPPGTCMQLEKLLRSRLPQQMAARTAEQQRSSSGGGSAEQAAVGQGLPPSAPEHEQQQREDQTAAAAAAAAAEPSSTSRSRPPPEVAALLNSGRPLHELWPGLQRALLQVANQEFVWHAVGCDGCGVYPIKGARYQCK